MGSIAIEIWYLERSAKINPGEASKVIVAAPSEDQARQIANEAAGTEGYVWNDGSVVEAKFLGAAAEGVYGLLMASKE